MFIVEIVELIVGIIDPTVELLRFVTGFIHLSAEL